VRAVLSRALAAGAALIFAFGGVMHAVAYVAVAGPAIAKAALSPFLASELKALWLADTTTLIGLACVTGLLVLRPQVASPVLIVLLATIPAGTTALVYRFVGPFYAAHLLLAACVMLVASALLGPAKKMSAM
jgi:hypothetical protein